MSRVLLVGRGAPERGGIAAFLALLTTSRLSERHALTLLNLTRTGELRGGRLDLTNLRRTLADARSIWRAAGGYDVVHVHTALAPLVTMMRASLFACVGRARGADVLIHAHGGLVADWSRSPARRLLTRVLLAPASHVITVAASVTSILSRSVGMDRLTLVENGVDVVRFAPTPVGEHQRASRRVPRVLYVGLLTPRKGVLDLLAASAELHDRGVAHELWLAGGRPDEGGTAEAEVRAATAASDAILLGTREHREMPALYDAVDVFCLPSWWEAMPLTVLEAMASGLPVAASRVGDVPRMVLPGDTGVLVAPRDPTGLADALQRVLLDGAERRRLGAAGRARAVEHYDLDRMIRQVDEIYRAAEERFVRDR